MDGRADDGMDEMHMCCAGIRGRAGAGPLTATATEAAAGQVRSLHEMQCTSSTATATDGRRLGSVGDGGTRPNRNEDGEGGGVEERGSGLRESLGRDGRERRRRDGRPTRPPPSIKTRDREVLCWCWCWCWCCAC